MLRACTGGGAIVAACDKRAAHLTHVMRMLGEIGSRHVPSKGSSAMIVAVGSHAGVSVPATGGGVRARTTQDWAEDACVRGGAAQPWQANLPICGDEAGATDGAVAQRRPRRRRKTGWGGAFHKVRGMFEAASVRGHQSS